MFLHSRTGYSSRNDEISITPSVKNQIQAFASSRLDTTFVIARFYQIGYAPSFILQKMPSQDLSKKQMFDRN